MTKEELLEMVNATITGNGKQEITGNSLNLALTEIINAMGTGNGGGGLIVHYLPGDLGSTAYGFYTIPEILNDTSIDFPYRELLQEYIDNNIKVYNILMDCNNNHTPVPGPIYFDTTFFDGYLNDRPNSVRGGCATAWRVDDYYGQIQIESSAGYTQSGNFNARIEILGEDGLIWNN